MGFAFIKHDTNLDFIGKRHWAYALSALLILVGFASMDETFLMIAVENLLMLRTFMRDYLHSFDKENKENSGYWPCVCVVADRNNLNFNVDLPKKIGLQWDNLMPDFPYLSYRNAYLLGEGFTVRDLRFTGEQMAMQVTR
jgi:hypothetical protein